MRHYLPPLAVALASLACAAPQTWGRRSAPATAGEQILFAAATISKEHVSPVDSDRLVREAALALDQDAGVAAPGAAEPAAASMRELIDAALARHRSARPEQRDARRVALALSAMARSLGDGSRLIEEGEEVRRLFADGTEDLPYGVGLVLERHEPFPLILRDIPGSPGVKAGLEPGLELRSIDGRSLAGVPLRQAAHLLRGSRDSEVMLEVGRPAEMARTVVVRREPVANHVDCRVLEGGVLYLRARNLDSGVASEVRNFAAVPGVPTRRAILDLRENTGGLLKVASDLADDFLDHGAILSVARRDDRHRQRHEATPGTSSLESARVAVLVDSGTGSGAEAVAAALQDNQRAVVVGTRTSGKARIQVIHEFEGGMVRLTIATLLRANGEAIDGRGVTPDVLVDPSATVPGAPLADAACPGFASPGPVSKDPVVARAVALLVMTP